MTIDIPLTRNELLVAGGAVALGVTEIISPPVALILAAAPLIRRGVRHLAVQDGAGQAADSTPRATPRRRRTPGSPAAATTASPTRRGSRAGTRRRTPATS